MYLVSSFLHIYVAYFSPSVTIALVLTGRKNPSVASKFCFARAFGALAVGCTRFLLMHAHVDIGPNEVYMWFQVTVFRILYTALVSFVYVNCGLSVENYPGDDQNGFVELAVGCCFLSQVFPLVFINF